MAPECEEGTNILVRQHIICPALKHNKKIDAQIFWYDF